MAHLFSTFCNAQHVAVLQRGTAGNHILLYLTSQFVLWLLHILCVAVVL